MKQIKFAGKDLVLDHRGALIWPDQKLAVVSDLHLEKGSYFARTGQMLPPHDSAGTLHRLCEILDFSGCQTLILLGDSFHDEAGYNRMDGKVRDVFTALCKKYDVIWIIGNHDGDFIAPHTHGEIELNIDGIMFRHEAEENTANEISGHYHPKARIKVRGSKVSRPCFIEDGSRMIMPSFGVFTGGLDIKHKAIAAFFKRNYTAHLLGERQIFSIPSKKV